MSMSGSRWLRCLAAVVAVALAGVGTAVLSATPAHAAALEAHTPVTYNMQNGYTYDQTVRWNTDVVTLLTNHDVVALQEPGRNPPPGAVLVGPIVPYPGAQQVDYYTWQPNPGGAVYHIYFLPTTGSDHRDNLAFVTWARADDVYDVPSTHQGSRLALGVRFGATAFWTINALLGSGPPSNNARNLINNVGIYPVPQGTDTAVLGDFGDGLGIPVGGNEHIVRTALPTMPTDGARDYMVTDRVVQAPLNQTYGARLINGMSSSHAAVEFGLMNLLQGEVTVAAPGQLVQPQVLDVTGGNADNGTPVTTYTHNGGDNQHWSLLTYDDTNVEMYNRQTHKCLDLRKGKYTRPGDRVHEWECKGQETAFWQLRPNIDPWGAYNFTIVNTYTGLCLDVLGDKHGDGSPVGVYDCQGSRNQQWLVEALSM
jgi:Ricin-type beta-trefoil lectin domain-like/Ricin-type beta-trefoil lectin domain